MKKILIAFGTRPEAIKMAPVIKALRRCRGAVVIVAVSGQHRQMLDQALSVFDIRPDFDLNLMAPGQTLSAIASGVLTGMDGVIGACAPDLVVVHGDTATAFASALSAFYHNIPIAHVEAGLRTGDKFSPYPEEMNRRLIAPLCDLHFAPTEVARQNLLRENIPPDGIFVTGNTAVDALLSVIDPLYAFDAPELRGLDFQRQKVILLTCHRRESFGAKMREIFRAVRDVLRSRGDVSVVFPVHKNPAVREAAREAFLGLERAVLLEPLEYRAFSNLMARTYLILTDSGGIQEEAPSLGKPVLVLRDATERPEALEAGAAVLVGTSYGSVKAGVERLLDDPAEYGKFQNVTNPYGDGHAAERIAGLLMRFETKKPIAEALPCDSGGKSP